MNPLQAGELTIEPASSDGLLVLRWLGKSNERDPGRLVRPYLQQALDEAEARHARLEMRFEKLEHFNSSTIAVLIQTINMARERQIEMALLYDRSLKWQALSFEALRRALQPFEAKPGAVRIEPV